MVYGGPVLYLIVQALFLFAILVWYDSGWRPAFLNKGSRPDAEDVATPASDDVRTEARRVDHSSDALRVLHVSKTFGRFQAVQDVSLGVAPGEVVALLGPNGAGKSTTIALVRGDIHRSQGDVLIEGTSVTSHRAAARAHLGVCPQFDAMDQMTAMEHLCFYARARGVSDVAANVSAVLAATGLAPYANRMALQLSGGNKRKLSLAIALMGNPAVLLLDEPSSGMDVAAKRVMWATLLGVAAPGRALLFTTHSMEEADHLASRVAIMKRRMLAVGSTRALRRRWGNGFVVHLVLRSAPATDDAEMQALRAWAHAHISGELKEEWGGHGQIRFQVLQRAADAGLASDKLQDDETQTDGSLADAMDAKTPVSTSQESSDRPLASGGMAATIQALEDARDELGLEYYSVSPTTLDDVFLKVVGMEADDENEQPPALWKRALRKHVWRRKS